MEYCLIEKWGCEYSLPARSIAVAVTPNACYELEKSGLEYFIFEDFCPLSKTQKENVDEYIVDQLSWFVKFDHFVQETFPDAKELNLKLASLYFYNIKYLADHLVTNLNVLNNFIDKTKPSKIWYVGEINGEDKCDNWHWFYFGKSSYFRLIEPLCERRGIHYEELIISKSENIIVQQNKSIISVLSDLSNLKLLLNKKYPWLLPLVKTIISRYKHWENVLVYNSSITKKRGDILVIKCFDYSNQFIRDALKEGYSLYFLEYDGVRTSSLFSKTRKIPFEKKKNIILNSNLNLEDVIQKILQGPIMNWINNKCGMDVSAVLRLRFEYLVKDLFPTTIGLVKGFLEYYNSNNIDYVFTNSLSTNYDFAAMAAARISQKTKSVGFFHGIDAEKSKHRYFMENYHFDLYFTSTIAEAVHIKKLSKNFGYTHPIVNTFPYFRDQFNGVAKKRKQMSSKRKKRRNQIILFLPIIRRYRSSAAYIKRHISTMTSIRWHNVLIDYFSSRNDCEFIWKDVGRHDSFDYSIYLKLKDNQYNNISYENKALKKYLPEVDKVICDLASTGFFECVFSGSPVITFNDKENNVMREDAFAMLGASLQSYSTLDEKLKIVEQFLDKNPEKYIVNLPEDKTSVIDILNENLITE